MEGRILIIDDDRELGEMLAEFLSPDHLAVSACLSGVDGLEALRKYPNMARLTFATDGFRPYLTCWPFMRDQLLARLREEALMSQDEAVWELVDELQALEPDAELERA